MLDNGENCRIIKKTAVSGGTKEVTSEISLPDYLPDVSRLLRTCASLGAKNSYVNGGSLEYDGEINYTIIYATSDGRIKSVPLFAEFEGSVSLPEIDGEFDVEEAIMTESTVCRLQNPRRLSVKSKLSVSADVYSFEKTAPTCGSLTSDEEAHTARRVCDIDSPVRTVASDENVPVSEDIELDAQLPPVFEIVSVTLSPYIYDVRAQNGALSYRGNVMAEVIYLAAQKDGNGTAEYYSFVKSVPISGEVDADGVGDNCFSFGYATVSAPEFRPQANALGENRVVELDFSYSARLVALCNERTTAVTDMYSTEFAGDAIFKNVEYRRALRAAAFNFTCDGTAPLDDKTHDKVVSEYATASFEKAEKNGTKAVMTGKTDVSVILTDGDGSYIGRSFSFPFKAETEVGKCAGELECGAVASVLGVSVGVENGEIRCAVEVGMSYCACDVSNIRTVDSFDLMKDRPIKRVSPASIVICYPSGDEELWDVAKRYGVTESALLKANSLSKDAAKTKALIIPPSKKAT